MKTTLTKTFYDKEAEFFINPFITIKYIVELDREGRTTVEVTFEADQ